MKKQIAALILTTFFAANTYAVTGVIDGMPVNAATTNAAFLGKNGDDSTTHKIGLLDTDVNSGTGITNAQRELNAHASILGAPPNQVYNYKFTWGSDIVGAASDSIKARIEALVNKFSGSTGHAHSGVDGDGAKISATNLLGVLPTTNGGTGQNSTATFPTSGAVATVPSSGVVKSNGTALSAANVSLSSEVTGTLPIGSGGTGQTTANAAINALLPSQTGNATKALITDGSNTSWGTVSGGNGGGGFNYLTNGTFESGVSTAWTTTTVTSSDETSTIYESLKSAKLTYSSQTGGISQSVTPTQNTSSINMEASCKVNTTMTTIEVCGLTGGNKANCQAVPASGTWQTVTSNFIGPANGTSVGVKVDTTASGTGTVYVDDCYVGPARNLSQVSQAQWLGDLVLTGCSGNWTATGNASYGDLGTQTGCTYTPSTASQLSAPATNLPAFKLSGGPGKYVIRYNGTIGNASASTNSQVFYQMTDGTNTSNEQLQWESSSGTMQPVTGGAEWTFYETTGFTAKTFDVKSYQVSGGQAWIGGTTTQPGVFSVYFYPSQQQTGYRADQTPGNWSGYHTLSGSWSVTSTTYADFGAGTSVTLSPLTFTNISCSTMAGSLPGITCTLPRSGKYGVCATVGANLGAAIGSFEITDGSNNIVAPGIDLSSTVRTPVTICGDYLASAAGTTTFKVRGANSTGTTNITQGTAAGAAAIQWQILEKEAPMPAPLFTGNITSSSKTQSFRLETMFFAGATQTSSCTGTCTTYMKSSDWFTGASTGGSVTRTTTGQYTLDYTGTFSGVPVCWTSVDVLNGASSVCAVDLSTITSSLVKIRCSQNNFSTNADSIAAITCMGPR